MVSSLQDTESRLGDLVQEIAERNSGQLSGLQGHYYRSMYAHSLSQSCGRTECTKQLKKMRIGIKVHLLAIATQFSRTLSAKSSSLICYYALMDAVIKPPICNAEVD